MIKKILKDILYVAGPVAIAALTVWIMISG